MRVEAGLDRLLLAVPGPLAPGRNRQHPPAPHRPMGLTRPGRSRRAGPVPGGCGSRCASPRRADVRPAASQSVCVVPSSQPRRRHPRPAGRRTSGAAAPPSDAASHPRRAPRRRLRSKEERSPLSGRPRAGIRTSRHAYTVTPAFALVPLSQKVAGEELANHIGEEIHSPARGQRWVVLEQKPVNRDLRTMSTALRA